MKQIIKRRNKTKFDYIARYLGVLSAILMVVTMTLVKPSSNKISSVNASLKEENVALLDENNNLNKQYSLLKDTIMKTGE
ncbi:MAG: hypothetical protein E7184_03865 [Erysipelotrichaceae bacterium]|nr:hypothetical protein [Erysipelotrichaceae bacterium]